MTDELVPDDLMPDDLMPDEPDGGGRPPQRRAIGPLFLFGVILLAILAVVWGRCVIDPEIQIFSFEAGPLDDLEVGDVLAVPSVNMYVIVLDEAPGAKQLRVVDGQIKATGCNVQWRPEDTTGSPHNPAGKPGIFIDTCGMGRWAATGDAIAGTSNPLRTPRFTAFLDDEGRQFVRIEVIGRADPRATPTPRN